MNDLMSLGLHRAWKAFAVGVARPRPGERVLDVAAGSGDLARALAKRVGPAARSGSPTSTAACSTRGRDRLLDAGVLGAGGAVRRRAAAVRRRELRLRHASPSACAT